MNKVEQILASKALSTVILPFNTPVLRALQLMAEKNIGSIVIVDENGNYMGIVTERDYSRKVVLKGKSSTKVMVEEIMSTDLPSISPRDTIDDCMEIMSNRNIRYLPVFANGSFKGIISMSDVVKATILKQQETIEHLHQYISL
jgi:signal-transduction protein with cAMP-binding, CBS, and nucleotidyltransferase domain